MKSIIIIQVFADLEGHKVNGLTIPPHIVVTSSRCDLVVIDSSTQPAAVYLFVLTICFEREENIAEFLGLRIQHDKEMGTVTITQTGLIDKILHAMGM